MSRRSMPGFARGLLDQRGHFRVGRRLAVLVVVIPARAGLLAVAAHFAQLVRHQRHAHAGFFEMLEFLADPPADVEPGQVAHGQRSHGHAEIVERLRRPASTDAPSSTRNCASRPIAVDHAVADEAAAISGQHADFVQLLGERHARSRSLLCWWPCRARFRAAASRSPG